MYVRECTDDLNLEQFSVARIRVFIYMSWLVNLPIDIESRISNLESRILNLVFPNLESRILNIIYRISNLEWSFEPFVSKRFLIRRWCDVMQILTGVEGNSNYISPRGTKYWPTRSEGQYFPPKGLIWCRLLGVLQT